MPRTSVTLTESSLNQVDSKAKEKGLTRSDYIAEAVESALHGTDADLNQMKTELNQLKMEQRKAMNISCWQRVHLEEKYKELVKTHASK